MINLVLFDMDGVIFNGTNFWLDLHKAMGTERQAWQLWKGLGRLDYRRLSNITSKKIWRQKSSDEFWNLVYARSLVVGIEHIFTYLNENKIKSAIISSGPYQLAERAQQLFHINEIRANKLVIGEDEKFTGEVDVQVDDNHKDITAKEVMVKFGATYDTTAMIGDTQSDVSIAKLVSLSIAYNSIDLDLLEACRYKLAAGDLHNVVDLLRER